MQARTGSIARVLTLVGTLALMAFAAPAAHAAFGIAKFEAITCEVDLTPADPCTGEDIKDFYTQAAGHPNFGITEFKLNTDGLEVPEGNVKDIRVELPEGLGVNPEATPEKCTVAELATAGVDCPLALVGANYLRAIVVPPAAVTIPVPVYNVEPPFGVPAIAGFQLPLPGMEPTLLVGDLNPVDQHISFTISDIETSPAVISSRLVFNGKAGTGYLTMPSLCAGGQTSILHVDSHQAPGTFLTQPYTTPVGVDGCENVPFDPAIEVTPSGGAVDSPEPVTADLQIPFNPNPLGITDSHLRTARVTLPEGMGLNPSAAIGLTPCTDAQFAKGTNDPIQCPASSRIGSVEVQTPSLPPDSVGGAVYVAQPLSNVAGSGNQFRVFVHASSPRFGVNVRLAGNLFPDPETGQLTALLDDNPQVPFSSFQLHIDGGPHGTLTSANSCGPHTAAATLTPWSNNPPLKTVADEFSLSSAPGGGLCPKTLADRPFAPAYSAGPTKRRAGAFTPFKLHFARPNGAQELRRIEAELPPGMVARLRDVSYCPESRIAAAAKRSGTRTTAKPACPKASRLGSVAITAGSGEPLHVNGNVYLAGPYQGAPVSLVFVTPAVAGPYDLGTVVVRAALRVEPETVQVTAVSDPIPYVFGGVKLDIRTVDVSIDRKRFTVNPTSCRSGFAVASNVFGGGASPADPASWFASAQSTPFRAVKCGKLRFRPKFRVRIPGGKKATQRGAHPRLRAVLKGRKGDANLSRAALTLPRAVILDQAHIRTICTRVQLAARECPKAAIYGHAKATSPLITGKLKGPVYLTSSNNVLPDLLVDLRGQVNVRLRGAISAKGGRLITVFRSLPDVAVGKFVLTMRGGKRGLLIVSDDLCERRRFALLRLKAQNGKRRQNKRLQLATPGCRKPR